MRQPITALDARFSQPGAPTTSWDETRSALESAQLFWITTVRADGRPHVSPLPAVWLDETLYFCTGSAEQKAVNLRSSAQVILTTGCNTWESGLDVVVEGTAARVTDHALLERLALAWTKKWDGRWRFAVSDGDAFQHDDGREALVFGVKPTQVLAFGKGTFSQTRHRF